MPVDGSIQGGDGAVISRTVSDDLTVETDTTVLWADEMLIADGVEVDIEDDGEVLVL